MGVWPSGGRVRRWRPRGDVENRACKTNARHEDTDMRASFGYLLSQTRPDANISPVAPYNWLPACVCVFQL